MGQARLVMDLAPDLDALLPPRGLFQQSRQQPGAFIGRVEAMHETQVGVGNGEPLQLARGAEQIADDSHGPLAARVSLSPGS